MSVLPLTRRALAFLPALLAAKPSEAKTMSLAPVVSPYQPINGLTGLGLNNGYLYIGLDGQDPEAYPQDCFWDAAGAVPAFQPISILGGYPMRLGSPARLYTAATYSIRVRDATFVQVFYEAHAVPGPNVGNAIFNTLADAVAAVIPPAYQVTGLTLLGYYAVGDGGGAPYRYATVQAAGAGKFRSGDGAWWQIAVATPAPLQLGAKGDGVTDDTTALQALVSLGKAVVLPGGFTFLVSAAIVPAVDGQQITGGGTLKASAGLAAVISANGRSGLLISGLTIIAGNSANADGILLTNCTDCQVVGNLISKHGNGGVHLTGCSRCVVERNSFSTAASNPTFGSPSASDVFLEASNDHCRIVQNSCHAAGGYGVQLATTADNQHNDYHVITGNVVDGYNSYGILLYRVAATAPSVLLQSIFGCVVTSNVVRNISGARPANPATPGVLPFGAGIYIQGAEKCVVSNNDISVTNTSTNSGLLAPGGIGVANTGDVVVSGNEIHDVLQHGIIVNDANNFGSTTGAANLIGNNIVSAAADGIKITTKSRIAIQANVVDTCVVGIHQSGAVSDVSVQGNRVANTSASGIALDGTTRGVVSGNRIQSAPAGAGIDISGSVDVQVNGNSVDAAQRGIYIEAGCMGALTCSFNSATNCTLTGINLSSYCIAEANNFDSNFTDYAGTYSPLQVAPAAGTWPAGAKVYTPAPFSGGFIGYVCVAGGMPGTWKSWGLIS